MRFAALPFALPVCFRAAMIFPSKQRKMALMAQFFSVRLPVLHRFSLALVALVATSAIAHAETGKLPLAGSVAKVELKEPRAAIPTFAFKNLDGSDASYDVFKGKVVLINFWATWCIPCIKEMPSLNKLATAIGKEKFAVMALSLDGPTRAKVAPFIRDKELTALDVYLDDKRAAYGKLDILVLPTSILVDKQGREVGRLAGDAEWDTPEALALIRHLINEN
jgi:thiol-disulfide isomerase/thioredoxin